MNKRFNFEDNNFILNMRIRMLRDMLILDTDPDLFMEKILDDVVFIDQTLAALLNNLAENHYLIEREEVFYHLIETERQFSELLAEMSGGSPSISAEEFPAIREKTGVFRQNSLERRKTIENSVAAVEETTPDTMVVSPSELSELLRDLK